jgi:hypothetical protein
VEQKWTSYSTFKHVARFLNIKMQDGMLISVDLGIPNGEERSLWVAEHKGIAMQYQSDSPAIEVEKEIEKLDAQIDQLTKEKQRLQNNDILMFGKAI